MTIKRIGFAVLMAAGLAATVLAATPGTAEAHGKRWYQPHKVDRVVYYEFGPRHRFVRKIHRRAHAAQVRHRHDPHGFYIPRKAVRKLHRHQFQRRYWRDMWRDLRYQD